MSDAHEAGEPSRAEVDEILNRLVGALAPDPVDPVLPEHTLVDDLGYYSLRLIELSFAVEELFEMEPMSLDNIPPVGLVSELQAFVFHQVQARLATVPTAESLDRYLEYV